MHKEQLLRSLRNRGFSEWIVQAFDKVDRKKFVPVQYVAEAYKDIALPIGKGQTISQPYTIAFMLSLLKIQNNQNILEVGSGSGYVLALINELSKNSRLWGIERIKELAEISQKVLRDKKNITIIQGNGVKDIPSEVEEGFDRILVSAFSENIPQKLVKELKVGGILVAPVKKSIIKLQKFANENKIKEYPGFVFVPLIED